MAPGKGEVNNHAKLIDLMRLRDQTNRASMHILGSKATDGANQPACGTFCPDEITDY
jgi:hypothetical protein